MMMMKLLLLLKMIFLFFLSFIHHLDWKKNSNVNFYLSFVRIFIIQIDWLIDLKSQIHLTFDVFHHYYYYFVFNSLKEYSFFSIQQNILFIDTMFLNYSNVHGFCIMYLCYHCSVEKKSPPVPHKKNIHPFKIYHYKFIKKI